ncbi:MAG: hypothetical protein ACYC37_01910 [Desulfobacteria bacterium]
MGEPRSPRGWLTWALRIREGRYSPRHIVLERSGRRDRRMDDSFETAISILTLLERSSNGAGPEGVSLVLAVATDAQPWIGLSQKEQEIVVEISRRFAKALREKGFLPREG